MNLPKELIDEFWSYVIKYDEDICWDWKGFISQDGASILHFKKQVYRANRVSYLIHYGNIPEGVQVLRKPDCKKHCINPNHLYLCGSDEDIKQRFWIKVNKDSHYQSDNPNLTPCWIWEGAINSSGYGSFRMNGRTVAAHRVAWELANNCKIPDGLWILHKCDVRRCVNPEHLYPGTHQDNIDDMMSRGRNRHPHGEEHRASKHTENDIYKIFDLYTTGNYTQTEIAKMFNTHASKISEILLGKTWRHIPIEKVNTNYIIKLRRDRMYREFPCDICGAPVERSKEQLNKSKYGLVFCSNESRVDRQKYVELIKAIHISMMWNKQFRSINNVGTLASEDQIRQMKRDLKNIDIVI